MPHHEDWVGVRQWSGIELSFSRRLNIFALKITTLFDNSVMLSNVRYKSNVLLSVGSCSGKVKGNILLIAMLENCICGIIGQRALLNKL